MNMIKEKYMDNRQYTGSRSGAVTERERRNSALARTLAAEGMVLLKNNRLLPLHWETPIALLGGGAVKTVKGGIGSGDVNNRENISIAQGLAEAGAQIVSGAYLVDYARRYDEARRRWKEVVLEVVKHVDNPFDAYADNPFALPEGRPVSPEDVKGAAAAVYVISRVAGEGKDRRCVAGDYLLSEQEQADLLLLNDMNIPTVLVLNAGGVVELTDILFEAPCIRAVLTIAQPGQEGGRAVADVLFGVVNPSGRLTATWASSYLDYPCANTAPDRDLSYDEYWEGIYMGYRYFDRFGVKPLFPFGYGLSYTRFRLRTLSVTPCTGGLEVQVEVTNMGRLPGKDVVQVYAALPQTGEERELRRLVGFAKTRNLQPGEQETVCVFLRQKQFASFSEERHCWSIDAGRYPLWVGERSDALAPVAAVIVEESVITEKNATICPIQHPFETLEVPDDVENLYAGPEELPEVPFVPVPEHFQTSEAELPTQDPQELIPLLIGSISDSVSTLGAAGERVPGSAGETCGTLAEAYGIQPLVMADGPAGLRLKQHYQVNPKTGAIYGETVLASLDNGYLVDSPKHRGAETYYQYTTAFPVGTSLAQMWNPELMEAFGRAVAEEMQEFNVQLWLAPGMNLHRNPLCGRNFEYFSEDPLLSGVLAAAVTRGVQSRPGCSVTVKHFVCNHQEDNRMGVDARVSERALRELCLRGFEIAVKEAQPGALMTSYNLVNGVHSANSGDLCNVVARQEWGFNGLIMSDWNTTVPEDGTIAWKCAAAGNDVIMPGSRKDEADLRAAYERGDLSAETIRSSAARVIALSRALLPVSEEK